MEDKEFRIKLINRIDILNEVIVGLTAEIAAISREYYMTMNESVGDEPEIDEVKSQYRINNSILSKKID